MKMIDDRHRKSDEGDDEQNEEWRHHPITGDAYNHSYLKRVEEEWMDRGLIR